MSHPIRIGVVAVFLAVVAALLVANGFGSGDAHRAGSAKPLGSDTVAVLDRKTESDASGVDAAGPPQVGAWQEVAPAPLGRLEVQGASANGKLYVFGGYVSWSPFCTTSAAYAYDPVADLWTQLPEMPAPWTHAGVAVDGADLYVAGGYENAPNCAAGEVATTTLYTYDTLIDAWRSDLPPLPEPRGSGALVRLGRTLHFFGGATTERSEPGMSEHWALPLDGPQVWTARAPLPNPRSHLSAVALGGHIYALGGQHFANEKAVNQRDVHRYDPVSDTWHAVAPLPLTLSHASSSTLVLDGQIVVIGGERAHNDHLDTVFSYDPQTDLWTQRPSLPVRANAGVAGHIGNALYFTNGGEFSAETYRAPVE